MNRLRRILDKVPMGLLSGVTVAAILWLTLAPHPTGDLELPMFPYADKVFHALMFGFLEFVLLLEWMKHKKWKTLTLPGLALAPLAVSAFGCLIEVLQHAMGLGRSLEVLDMLADSAGAYLVAGVWAALQDYIAVKDDN